MNRQHKISEFGIKVRVRNAEASFLSDAEVTTIAE